LRGERAQMSAARDARPLSPRPDQLTGQQIILSEG
jgi:hypothetical protein